MPMLALLLLAAVSTLDPAPTPEPAPQRRGDAQAALDARRAGLLSPREIERRVVPAMKGAEYLGFDFDGSSVYTLKFVRDGAVIWVDVDGRTGQIIGRTGR